VSHQLIDERSLELHRAIVERLRANPELVDHARRNLHRWLSRPALSKGFERCYREWLELLDIYSFEDLISLLTEDSERAKRLRQNSPFTGILSPREVWEIKRRFLHAAH
jgi:hypothetical protein